MSWDPSAYGRSFADVYDEWYADRDDVESLVTSVGGLVPGGRPRSVLELGVGTGRLAIPLADAGWRVVGLDASPEMLAVLGAKGGAVHACLGDASVASDYPEGPFDLVLGAYNFIFNLLGRDAQRACLAASAGVVASGGALVLEAFVPDAAPPSVPVSSPARAKGVTMVSRVDPTTGIVHGEHRHGDGRSRPWQVCPARPSELDALAESAGWHLDQRWAGWDGSPFEPDHSPAHVSIYRRL